MTKKSKFEDSVLEVAEEVAASVGLEVYDLLFNKSGPRWKLQLFLTREEGAVTLDDCATVSRQISRELDLLDPIEEGYDLEVSSPGLERPLRTLRHWQQAAGDKAKVRWRDTGGKVQTLVATVGSITGDVVSVQPDAQSPSVEIPLASVLSARLQVDW